MYQIEEHVMTGPYGSGAEWQESRFYPEPFIFQETAIAYARFDAIVPTEHGDSAVRVVDLETGETVWSNYD